MKRMYRFLFLLVMFISASQLLFAQAKTITGVISTVSGASLPGVNILIKGTHRGTVSDLNGRYKINATQGDVLVFSFLGFDTKEVKVSGTTTTINVVLKGTVSSLNEVVVTAFGIKRAARQLSYSITQIKPVDVNIVGQSNPLLALQGRVPGLQISNTAGAAGGGVNILIRGLTSVNPGRNNQPLVIVDGMAVNNSTTPGGDLLPSSGSNAVGGAIGQFDYSNRAGDINPDDIASISVLKGAAATALYGVRAANGVILITTKKGELGKPKVNVILATTFSDIVKTPALQKTYRAGDPYTNPPLPGAVINPKSPSGYDDYGVPFWSWGVPFTDKSFTMPDGTVVDLSHDRFYNPYDLFRTGVNKLANFNVSGANKKFNYFFSASDNKDEGVLPNTHYDKKTFRFNSGYQILKNLKISSSVSYTKSNNVTVTSGDKSVFSALAYWSSTYPIRNFELPDGSENNYSDGIIDNPMYNLMKSNLRSNLNHWIGRASLNWKPFKWMTATYAAQMENYSELRNRFVPPDLDVGSHVGGFITDDNINFTGLESNLLVTIDHRWNKNFNTTLMLGNQVSDTRNVYSYIRGEHLNLPFINSLTNTLNTFAGKTLVRLRNVGVFGDFRVGFKRKLYLSVTGRNDWVSTLSKNNRSFFYPSVGLSYIFTQDIFKHSKVFTFGKIRVSWAQVGKGPNFGSVGHYFISDPAFPFNGAGGYRASTSLGATNLKPERDNNFSVGTNLHFFNNRLSINYTYYSTYVTNQIFTVGSSYASGLSGITRNAGDLMTWGDELSVNVGIIRNSKIRWQAIINWSKNGGRVVSLPKDLKQIVFFSNGLITEEAKVGDALGTLYGYVFQTVDHGKRYVNPKGEWVVTGSENKGNPWSGTNQMVKVGNAFPDFVASMDNIISWKNLSFNFLIGWKHGGDLYDMGYLDAMRNGNLKETEFRNKTRILSGMMDNGHGGYVKNTIPLLITGESYYRNWANYWVSSQVLLQNGSWIKLRTIGLSYRFTGRLVKRAHLDKLIVFANAHNIILWTPFKGFDPEANSFSANSNIYGFTGLTVPLSQSYSFGIKLGF